MIGWIKQLMGAPSAGVEIAKSISSGLDYLVHTDQEKAEAAAAQLTEARSMLVKWMEATQGQNIARRLIGLGVTGYWMASLAWAQFCATLAVWLPEREAQLLASKEVSFESAELMAPYVGMVVAFYFAAPYMGDAVKVFAQRMGTPPPESANRTG